LLKQATFYVTNSNAVTDDIEIDQKAGTTVKLKPRKYGSFRKTSRSGVYGKAEVEELYPQITKTTNTETANLTNKKNGEPAGFEIHGRAFNPDLEESFDAYKQFDIEFENDQCMLSPNSFQQPINWRNAKPFRPLQPSLNSYEPGMRS